MSGRAYADDQFGYSVSASEDFLVISAPHRYDSILNNTGSKIK